MKEFEYFDLTEYNSYRIKSFCAKAFLPETEEDIPTILSALAGQKYFIIGSGHNIILSKPYYTETFVVFANIFQDYTVNGNVIAAESGMTMLELSQLALTSSLSGLEIFYDIPSSLGGAVVMNAGAGGEEIKDVLIKVRYFDPDVGRFSEVTREEIGFEYRNSLFQKNPQFIVTKAWLELSPGRKDAIWQKMSSIKEARWAKQPREFPNAGSVFKRPPGRYVGSMIEDLKLKGFSIGGAKISEKHGGFIINFDAATGENILDIIDHVRSQVLKHFNVDLEVEQRIL